MKPDIEKIINVLFILIIVSFLLHIGTFFAYQEMKEKFIKVMYVNKNNWKMIGDYLNANGLKVKMKPQIKGRMPQ